MSTREAIRIKVIGIVRDDAAKLKDPEDYDRLIDDALMEYSRHRPGTKAVDVTGNGGSDYAVSGISGWVDGFSGARRVEYPVDDVPESLLDDDTFYVYEKPTGKVLRLRDDAPLATETFRLTFTIPRTVTTVPDNDVGAVANLAASLALSELANAYAQTGDSLLQADSVNYRTKSQEFASRAKEHRKIYLNHLGIKEGDTVPPASAVSDTDVGYPGGGDRLTHPRRKRKQRW